MLSDKIYFFVLLIHLQNTMQNNKN